MGGSAEGGDAMAFALTAGVASQVERVCLDSRDLARHARAHALRMVHRAKASHIGAALSMIDILAVLYADTMRVRPEAPGWPERDRLIVSKGHGAVGLYAILGELGFFPREELDTYGTDGARLMGHVSHRVPGVELSTGSLGHGLPVAGGLALGLPASRVFCVLGDGELDEGSNWEAAMFAAHHRLGNLTAIVDHNRIQSLGRVEDVLSLGSIAAKFAAFGWRTVEVDGHDHDALRDALSGEGAPWSEERAEGGTVGGSAEGRDARLLDASFGVVPQVEGVPKGDAKTFGIESAGNAFQVHRIRPLCIVAHTVKGKGVDFMEDSLAWHYKSPDDAQLAEALRQVGA